MGKKQKREENICSSCGQKVSDELLIKNLKRDGMHSLAKVYKEILKRTK